MEECSARRIERCRKAVGGFSRMEGFLHMPAKIVCFCCRPPSPRRAVKCDLENAFAP